MNIFFGFELSNMGSYSVQSVNILFGTCTARTALIISYSSLDSFYLLFNFDATPSTVAVSPFLSNMLWPIVNLIPFCFIQIALTIPSRESSFIYTFFTSSSLFLTALLPSLLSLSSSILRIPPTFSRIHCASFSLVRISSLYVSPFRVELTKLLRLVSLHLKSCPSQSKFMFLSVTARTGFFCFIFSSSLLFYSYSSFFFTRMIATQLFSRSTSLDCIEINQSYFFFVLCCDLFSSEFEVIFPHILFSTLSFVRNFLFVFSPLYSSSTFSTDMKLSIGRCPAYYSYASEIAVGLSSI